MFVLDYLYQLLVHVVPFTVALWDSGYYSTFNSQHASEYMEAGLQSRRLL